jgi:putative membrane protein
MMGYGMMNGYGFGGMGLLGGVFSLVINLALIVGLVWLVVWAVRRFTNGTSSWQRPSGGRTPRDILQTRYARGEVTREQYQQMLKDLG